MSDIKKAIKLSDEIKHTNLSKIVENVKKGDFSIMTENISFRLLTCMYQAIKDTPGAVEWFKKDGMITSKDPMLWTLSGHSKVKECGHSGMSMSWIFSQFRTMYQKGFDIWTKQVLKNNGIEVDSGAIDEVDKIAKQVEKGDFSNIPRGMSSNLLTHMYQAIKETPGAIEWVKIDQDLKSDDEIFMKLSNHPEVKKDKLSGYCLTWILCQFQIMYNKGFDSWTKEVLKNN